MVLKVFPRNIVNVFHLNESLSELSEKELEILHDDLNEKEKLKECDEKKKENEAQKKKAEEENQWQQKTANTSGHGTFGSSGAARNQEKHLLALLILAGT